ncbi:hypothetical protein [Streptomyces lydicus]|uniref:hypothetical protein n=1 Tax=Streptomyces lydicus TaxID=47763 RepID=UPI0037B4EE32
MTALDERLAQAAAIPVITPETIVCDRGKAYISDTFRSACQSLGISFQPAHPDTPTDKPHIERTLQSVATMFTKHLPGHKGRSTEHRGTDPAAEALWTIHQLQEPLQEWIIHWQMRPHDGLRDPLMPGKALSPNEKYAVGTWIMALWRHLRTAPTPMGELAWDHARRVLAQRGTDPATEEEIAQAAVDLLDRAADGPQDAQARPSGRSRKDRKVAARTRATSTPSWPRPAEPEPAEEPAPETAQSKDDLADVIPLGIFDARKEAETWW